MNTEEVVNRTARDALSEHLQQKRLELESCTEWTGDAATVEARIHALREEIDRTAWLVTNFDKLEGALITRSILIGTAKVVTAPVWLPIYAITRPCVR